MPTVTMSFPNGEYLSGFDDYNPSLGELLFMDGANIIGTPSATRIVYRLESGLVLRLNGTGFSYDAEGYPTGGTMTGLQLFLEDGTTVLQTVTGFNLPLIDVFDM